MKRMISIVLAAALLLALTGTALAADSAKATTLRLSATEGTVTLTGKTGRNLSVLEDMKLYSGYTVKTEAASYAYISLDKSKAVKLDASTTVEIRKSGKKLEVLVTAGKLFFNVTVPLEEDETLEIRTATIVTGVRGTAGIIDCGAEGNSTLQLLDGSVTMQAVDPATGKSVAVPVQAGQTAVVSRQEAGSTVPAVAVKAIEAKEVPGFVATEIAKDTALQNKITQQSTLDVKQVVEKAAETLAREQKAAAVEKTQVEQALGKEENKQAEAPTAPATEPPKDNTSGGGDFSDGETPSVRPGRLNGNVSLAALDQALATYNQVILTSTARADLGNSLLTVAQGKTLALESGAKLTIGKGGTLRLRGGLENAGTVTLVGTAELGEAGSRALVRNTGSVVNQGTLDVNCTVENAGNWLNDTAATMNLGGSMRNSGSLTNKGTVVHAANAVLTSSGAVVIEASGTWTNRGTVHLGGDGLVSRGNLAMEQGRIERTDSAAAAVEVEGAGKITFTGGLFSSDSNKAVIPEESFATVDNELTRLRGRQGNSYVLGCGLNNLIVEARQTPTTIVIDEDVAAAEKVTVAAGQTITLEMATGGVLTFNQSLENNGALTLTSTAEIDSNKGLTTYTGRQIYAGASGIAIANKGTLLVQAAVSSAVDTGSTIVNDAALTIDAGGEVSGLTCAISNGKAGRVTVGTGGLVTSSGCGINNWKDSGTAGDIVIDSGTVELTKETPPVGSYAISGTYLCNHDDETNCTIRAKNANNLCSEITSNHVKPETAVDGWYYLMKK